MTDLSTTLVFSAYLLEVLRVTKNFVHWEAVQICSTQTIWRQFVKRSQLPTFITCFRKAIMLSMAYTKRLKRHQTWIDDFSHSNFIRISLCRFLLQALKALRCADLKPFVVFIKSPCTLEKLMETRSVARKQSSSASNDQLPYRQFTASDRTPTSVNTWLKYMTAFILANNRIRFQ